MYEERIRENGVERVVAEIVRRGRSKVIIERSTSVTRFTIGPTDKNM